ncbi:MAG: Ig-like domain-containing protein, partial [Bacteroidales bacterium]|nr:Ig-like domain-containing protein [Bacteroidales bacterium]
MLAVIGLPAAVTGVSLDAEELTLLPGEAMPLTATVTPADATDKSVSWSSSNTYVATVSSEGLVTAVAPGIATITVTTEDGGFTADCIVNVYSAITLVSPTMLYDSSTRLGWNARGNIFLGDGYVPGTQCFHANNHPSTNKYRVAECAFPPVDVSSIANPALLIRFYINKPEE